MSDEITLSTCPGAGISSSQSLLKWKKKIQAITMQDVPPPGCQSTCAANANANVDVVVECERTHQPRGETGQEDLITNEKEDEEQVRGKGYATGNDGAADWTQEEDDPRMTVGPIRIMRCH